MNANAPRLRPRPARWFELLVARDDATLALEALAATGAVELEARSGTALPASFADLRPLLQRFAELAQRYRAWWPADGLEPSAFPEPPLQSLQRSIERIRAWATDAEPLIRRLQALQTEAETLRHWRRAAAALAGGPIDLGLARHANTMRLRLVVLPAAVAAELGAPPAGLLVQPLPVAGAESIYLLVLGSVAQVEALAQPVHALEGKLLAPPDWLHSDPQASVDEAGRRLDALRQREDEARAALAALTDAHDLRPALADAHRLQWVLDNVHALEAGPLFCWVTGWTSTPRDEALEQAVEASGARALLRFPAPPAGARAPMLLANPAWVRPFEVFARALGMPGGNEADPSALLAVAVPLMFGYMFGDVGQGLVIAAAGFALRRRFPIARLFIAGGLAAAAFGLLFGSVFGLHVLHPWWIAPLDDPLAVLVVPLIGGAVLLGIGLALSAIEAHWRDELGRWFATDFGLLLAYLGLLLALLDTRALALAAAGAAVFCLGHGALERRQGRPWSGAIGAALAAIGELLERLLQLLINTLSFARVGAFALAHAGLSSAIVALMGAAGHPLAAAAVLVVGNVIVMLLEGLVVSIQTTRLVLFEFFARFLEAQGRVFRPLPPPPSTRLSSAPSTLKET